MFGKNEKRLEIAPNLKLSFDTESLEGKQQIANGFYNVSDSESPEVFFRVGKKKPEREIFVPTVSIKQGYSDKYKDYGFTQNCNHLNPWREIKKLEKQSKNNRSQELSEKQKKLAKDSVNNIIRELPSFMALQDVVLEAFEEKDLARLSEYYHLIYTKQFVSFKKGQELVEMGKLTCIPITNQTKFDIEVVRDQAGKRAIKEAGTDNHVETSATLITFVDLDNDLHVLGNLWGCPFGDSTTRENTTKELGKTVQRIKELRAEAGGSIKSVWIGGDSNAYPKRINSLNGLSGLSFLREAVSTLGKAFKNWSENNNSFDENVFEVSSEASRQRNNDLTEFGLHFNYPSQATFLGGQADGGMLEWFKRKVFKYVLQLSIDGIISDEEISTNPGNWRTGIGDTDHLPVYAKTKFKVNK